ncbi:hypothetical protein WJX77_012297 [Trebouxia sp. C0004]
MQATRAYDALYDSTYTVSAQQDHYREQSRAGGICLGRVPQYDNLFSALGHHPAQTFRYKTHDKLPSHIPRGYEQHHASKADSTAASLPAVVSGAQRYLYSRRPLLVPGLYHPDIYSLHMLPTAAEPESAAAEVTEQEPVSRTVATQSDYRESEAQTTPWDVDYVIPDQPSAKQQYLSAMYHCQGPEVLALRDLKLGNGLPVGLAEVEEIEKRRVKRAFEAALPPLDDLQHLPLRQQLLEAWEAQEWADREASLEATQDAKVLRLEASLQHREEQIENHHAQRINALRARRSREVQQKLAYVHRQRVSTILHLEDAQRTQRYPDRTQKPDIIDRYSQYSSGVYAPMQREGRFPDSRPVDQRIDTRPYQPSTYAELLELEASLPQRHLMAKVQAPGSVHKLNYLQHREEKVAADLALMASLLGTSRQNNTIGDMGATYSTQASMKMSSKDMTAKMATTTMLKRTARTKSRTDAATPSKALLLSMDPEKRKKDAAALVLQRLLRGRAAQTKMYEGLQSRIALIRELQMQRGTPDSKEHRRPESRSVQEMAADSLVGKATSEILMVLAEQDPEKRAQMMDVIDTRRGASLSRQSAQSEEETASEADPAENKAEPEAQETLRGEESSAKSDAEMQQTAMDQPDADQPVQEAEADAAAGAAAAEVSPEGDQSTADELQASLREATSNADQIPSDGDQSSSAGATAGLQYMQGAQPGQTDSSAMTTVVQLDQTEPNADEDLSQYMLLKETEKLHNGTGVDRPM